MNYEELKAAVIADTKRTDQTDNVPRYIREAEGALRRMLTAYTLSYTFDDTDRGSDSTSGIYLLPGTVREIRQVYSPDRVALQKVSLAAIPPQGGGQSVRCYAPLGNRIQLYGIPAEGAEFDMEYFGLPPALVDDSDTNELLTDHESLYIEGASYHLYKVVEDFEMADRSWSAFSNIIENLNDSMAKLLGGMNTSGGYNFRSRSSY